MATLGTPFKRSHIDNSNFFDVLDESDNGAASRASTPVSIVSQPQHSLLREIAVNKIHGVSRTSPDDLAAELETFHIATPTKINKTRGLKPRPTIGSSTFYFPDRGQENTVDLAKGDGAATAVAADLGLLRRANESLPGDAFQLAKHRAGEFEYVLSLPAVTTTEVDKIASGTSNSPKDTEEVTTIHFGCNLVCADGSSELGWGNGSAPPHSYTLIATPIETDQELPSEVAPSATEQVDDMGAAADANISEIHTLPGLAEEIQIKEQQMAEPRSDDMAGIGGPSKSKDVAEVTEISVLSPSADKPESGDGQKMTATIRNMNTQNHAQTPAESKRNHDLSSRRTSETVPSGKKDDIVDEFISLPPVPSPSSRIEDSVEALDELEEQLEAINEVTQLDRVLSPEQNKARGASINPETAATATKRTQPSSATSTAKASSGTVRAKALERKGSVRQSIAGALAKDVDEPTSKSATGRRLSVVPRPASLAPPKPLVRSAKPATVPTFELPGEAVARRLKEKREARLSMSLPASSHTPARSSSPTKVKTATSTKPPTKPDFELPGEAISRRKREEREARLKAEQEEERKKREFKARPIRASLVAGATLPRQTAASLARISLKAAMANEAPATVATPSATSNKRHSTIGPASTSRPSLTVTTTNSSVTRGRGSVALSPSTTQMSRATSSSTGSGRGGSSVGAEELQQQKQRGKEIFKRENSVVSERERERRSREEAAKKAREEAAERSRQLSREWAEKQRLKKMAGAGVSPSLAA